MFCIMLKCWLLVAGLCACKAHGLYRFLVLNACVIWLHAFRIISHNHVEKPLHIYHHHLPLYKSHGDNHSAWWELLMQNYPAGQILRKCNTKRFMFQQTFLKYQFPFMANLFWYSKSDSNWHQVHMFSRHIFMWGQYKKNKVELKVSNGIHKLYPENNSCA